MPKVIKLQKDFYLYGTIIEEGSNSNGSWIKYSSGLMICTLNIRRTDISISQSYPPLYLGHYTWTYPQPFAYADVVVNCGTFHWGTGASWGTSLQPGINNVMLRGYDYYSRPAGTEVLITATAIGRWK